MFIHFFGKKNGKPGYKMIPIWTKNDNQTSSIENPDVYVLLRLGESGRHK